MRFFSRLFLFLLLGSLAMTAGHASEQTAIELPKPPTPEEALLYEKQHRAALEKQQAESLKAEQKQCESKGDVWDKEDSRCLNKEEIPLARECKQKGGVWGQFEHWAMKPECRIPAKDAGKPCQKNADCSYQTCVVDPGSSNHGICADGPWRGEHCSTPCYFNEKEKTKECGSKCVE